MWRVVRLSILALFVASSTGFALTLHLHDSHADHDSSHCAVCYQLTTGRTGHVDEPAPLLVGPEFRGMTGPVISEAPAHVWPEISVSPRAPPAS